MPDPEEGKGTKKHRYFKLESARAPSSVLTQCADYHKLHF